MMIILGFFIPFIGTILGSMMVFFMKNHIPNWLEKILLGFSAGVMIAASVWSLLIPSIELSDKMGVWSWIPAAVGFIIGIVFLMLTNFFLSNYWVDKFSVQGGFYRVWLMVLAVTLHNIPEGMAVGVIFASVLSEYSLCSLSSAFSLAIGIAIQNFPEGAIISMPLKGRGMSRFKAFLFGVLSGVVEPISAVITLILTRSITLILPYLLSFAAGAMIYVVVSELIPHSQEGDYSSCGLIGISAGFVLMMVLDVALS